MIYFFDTYAFIEVIKGNPRYEKYLEVDKVTTRLNLMELYFALLRDFNSKTAGKYYDFFSVFAIPVEDSTVKKAMFFKLKNKREKLSYVDCIGYMIALENGIKFLTGDEKFEDKKGVEFVK